ncbi:MAG: hypothetical protein KDD34_01270 [Bdellovibrionales bacterium]|nr:hypothetical protein [Bdellovibrionales bacterium]
MFKIQIFKILILSGSLAIVPNAFSKTGTASLTGTEFKTCIENNGCLSIQSDSADGTPISQLYVFKRPKFSWTKKNKTLHGIAIKATVDFSLNQVIITERLGNTLIDHLFSLKTLDHQKFEVKL